MVRKLFMICVVLLVAVSSQACVTAWFLSAPDLDSNTNEYKVRLGVQNADTEFGVQLDYYGVHGSPPGQQYGAYAIVHLDKAILTDLLGQQYLGFAATVVTEDADIGSYGPIVGALRPINENIAFVIEYQYRDFNEEWPGADAHKVVAGFRINY